MTAGALGKQGVVVSALKPLYFKSMKDAQKVIDAMTT